MHVQYWDVIHHPGRQYGLRKADFFAISRIAIKCEKSAINIRLDNLLCWHLAIFTEMYIFPLSYQNSNIWLKICIQLYVFSYCMKICIMEWQYLYCGLSSSANRLCYEVTIKYIQMSYTVKLVVQLHNVSLVYLPIRFIYHRKCVYQDLIWWCKPKCPCNFVLSSHGGIDPEIL